MRKTNKFSAAMGILFLMVVLTTAVPVFASTTGGWTVSKARCSFLTSGEEKIFNKAVKGLMGVSYKPAALLAKQTVAGTNYVFLCQGTTVTKKPEIAWYILNVNEDLKNKVSLLSVKKIEISSVEVNKNPHQGTVDGGLEILAFENKPEALSKSVLKIFSKGIKKYAGYELRPISLLGTQVVAGQNYRFLCYGAGPAGKDLFVVDIYRNVKGKCSISSCKSLDLEKYIN